MLRSINFLCYSSVAGGTAGIVGAIAHQDVVTWVGILTAIGSALASTVLHVYHQVRQARREEMLADHQLLVKQILDAFVKLDAVIHEQTPSPTTQPPETTEPQSTRAFVLKMRAQQAGTPCETQHREKV